MVIYVLNAGDAADINDRRKPVDRLIERAAGENFPAVVVKVQPDQSLNLQVFLDGRDGMYWATRVKFSEKCEPGTWHLP